MVLVSRKTLRNLLRGNQLGDEGAAHLPESLGPQTVHFRQLGKSDAVFLGGDDNFMLRCSRTNEMMINPF